MCVRRVKVCARGRRGLDRATTAAEKTELRRRRRRGRSRRRRRRRKQQRRRRRRKTRRATDRTGRRSGLGRARRRLHHCRWRTDRRTDWAARRSLPGREREPVLRHIPRWTRAHALTRFFSSSYVQVRHCCTVFDNNVERKYWKKRTWLLRCGPRRITDQCRSREGERSHGAMLLPPPPVGRMMYFWKKNH